MLLLGFSLDHACSHCAAWLQELYTSLLAFPGLGDALVLVAPDDKVKEGRDLALHQTLLPGDAEKKPLVLVLVDHQDVEPIVFALRWPFELNVFLLKRQIQSFVTHVSNPVDCDFCASFLEEDRPYFKLFDVCNFAKVVDVIVCARLIKCTQHLEANWIIVVPVNRKDRQPNSQGWIQKVGFVELSDFEEVLFGCHLFLGLF